ncbi:NfeD family protein [Maridesulfovibrio frigidus]|uniref:NfeD family protein n=1 Tax=Maridesulfovibrio frigidus TaxID=340956 RepID=UPI0012EC9675|nr:NfeD family protein [Maridesulfovibrio frigidus]
MGNYPLWLMWLVGGIFLAMLELAVPGMVIIFFSLGCFAAAVVAAFVSEIVSVQIAVFCVASVFSLVVLRKVFMNWFQGQTSAKVSGDLEDSPDGALAEASKDFPENGYGQIRYRGSFWKAVADSGQSISAGEPVKIISWVDKRKTAFLVTKSINA